MAAKAPLGSAVQRFLRALFGGDFVEVDGTLTADATPAKLVDNDPERVELIVTNLGSTTIYLRPTPQVSATAGLPITANGGIVGFNVRNDATLPTREWWVVSPSGNVSVYFVQARRYTETPD